MAEHKGFDPSPKKLKEARKKGQVIKSQILSQSAAFTVTLACLINGLPSLFLNQQGMIEWCLSVSTEHWASCSLGVGSHMLWVILGSLLAGVFALILVEIIQVKFEFFWEPLGAQVDRLNPVAGFKRMGQGLCKSWLLVLKLVLVLLFAKHCLLGIITSSHAAILIPGKGQIFNLLPQVARLMYISSSLLLIFGAFEYLFNRRRFLKEQSMTHDEVRREYKEDEGDPHVKSHRKALHEAMIMQEMVKRVRSSKVIIVD